MPGTQTEPVAVATAWNMAHPSRNRDRQIRKCKVEFDATQSNFFESKHDDMTLVIRLAETGQSPEPTELYLEINDRRTLRLMQRWCEYVLARQFSVPARPPGCVVK